MSFIRRHSVLFFLPAIIQDVHCLQLLSTMRKEALPEFVALAYSFLPMLDLR